MDRNLAVVMDPIGSITIKKDSTFAMLLEATRRGWQLYYMEQSDLYLYHGEARGRTRGLSVRDDPDDWYTLGEERDTRLGALDVILLRKDPPFDQEFLYMTYILELATAQGALVANDPRSVRDANEKLFVSWFPDCAPATLVSRERSRLKEFIIEHGDVVLKPLDSMGGQSVFRVRHDDDNLNVILETMTRLETRTIIAQKFVPEIRDGDKRILVIDGVPFEYALARIPAAGETRANLAAGGRGVGVPLSSRDRLICDQVSPVLRDKKLLFVGLDVIGDYLTEINVTSPTCIRELDALYDTNISTKVLDSIESHLPTTQI